MIQYREILIKQILQSVDKTLIEPLIENSLQNLSEKGTHPYILIRFIDKLKTSLSELKKEERREQEINNIIQALNVLNAYDARKSDEHNTNKKHQ